MGRDHEHHPNEIHGQLPERLAFDIVDVHDSEARAVLQVDDGMLQTGGVLHGGVMFTLADSVAANLALRSFAPNLGTTTDASIRFLKAVRSGTVTATATIAHRGGRTRLIEVGLTDAEGELVGLYQGSFLQVPNPDG